MSEAYVGQIMPCAFNYPPRYWALCNGQIMAISQNQALFSLLGTFYGGNGQTNFALPDLRSRTPIGSGAGQFGTYVIGQLGGAPTVALTSDNLPPHSHLVLVSNADPVTNNSDVPTPGAVLGRGTVVAPGGGQTPINLYNSSAANIVPTALGAVAGAGQPHDNMQPYSVINFCICLNGLFPSRN
jgi:microcystin-dependent protein